jgi:hypothetical protein
MIPQALRELSWRVGAAGTKISEAEAKVFGEKGLRPQQGMKIYDTIRCLNHVLSISTGRTLADFQVGPWEPMLPGSIRHWDVGQQRWLRTSSVDGAPPPMDVDAAGASAGNVGAAPQENDTLELPDEQPRADQAPLLLLTMDQASAGWAAAHFLAAPAPGGMGLLVHFQGDTFHRSWNDFRWACGRAKGHIKHSMIQMTICYNCNYGPWLRAAFMAKKKEALLEYISMSQGHEVPSLMAHASTWGCVALLAAQDAREPTPGDEEGLTRLFDEQVLCNHNFQKKGPYVKMCSWYSIIDAIEYYDPVWTSWKHLMEWLSTNLLPTSAKKSRDKVTQELAGAMDDAHSMTSTDHKAQLMEIKRSAGNVLLMTPLLLTAENLFNMRLLLLVGQPLRTEQSLWASCKTTGDAQRKHSIALSCGSGLQFCRELWRHVTFDARELERLGCIMHNDGTPYPLTTSAIGLEVESVLDRGSLNRTSRNGLFRSCSTSWRPASHHSLGMMLLGPVPLPWHFTRTRPSPSKATTGPWKRGLCTPWQRAFRPNGLASAGS